MFRRQRHDESEPPESQSCFSRPFPLFNPSALFDFTRRHYNNRVLEREQEKPVQKKTVKSRCGAQSLCADTCRLMLTQSNQNILRKRGIEHVNTAAPTRARYALNKGGKAARGRQNHTKLYSTVFAEWIDNEQLKAYNNFGWFMHKTRNEMERNTNNEEVSLASARADAHADRLRSRFC